MERAEQARVGHAADHRARQLPAVAHHADRGEPVRLDDRDHPLLRLRDHDLPRLHALLAQRHTVELDVDADAVGGHLGERGREARGAAVLQRLDEALLDELERDLDELLAGERVADLHGRALVGVALAQLGTGQYRGTANAITPGRRAVEDDDAAGLARLRRAQPLGLEQPDAHRVDEAVAGVRGVEDGLPADVRDADAVAVVADPRDGLPEVEVGLAEPEAVEQRDRPRAHGDDVAEDPADPRRGALERLDRGRVVVRLDLERDRHPVPEVEHAGVLAWALQHALAGRREPLQERRRVLVAAVLRPEEREDRELEVVRIAPEQLLDSPRFPVRETEGPM